MKNKTPWHQMSADMEFISRYPPGRPRTVDEQLELDRILFGVAFYQIGDDGKKIRIDPAKIVRLDNNEPKRKSFWLSIRIADKCLFSRRNGYVGRIIAGYSICLRLFNYDIL